MDSRSLGISPHPTRSELQRTQLGYAARGKPTFPVLRGGKTPLIKDWPNEASTDPRKINMWRYRWPLANVGMPTGERSGVWVLDVDSLEALEELEREHGRLPITLIVRTPSGGLHLYFRHADGITNSPGGLPKGIDVRGEGGYVLVPPSGGYSWSEGSPVAEAPAWLLELVRERSRDRERKPKPAPVPQAGEEIPEGSRNRTLFFEALRLKDTGGTDAEVLAGIQAANAGRCSPPLDAGEIERIAGSAMRYPVRSGSPSPELDEALRGLESRWWRGPWPGMGGKTDRDVYRVLLELAGRYGRLREDGSVEVAAAVRTVALAAATTFETVSRGATRRLRKAGLVRKTDADRGAREAATWVLLPVSLPINTGHELSTEEEMPCVDDRLHPRLRDLSSPAFRWTGLVKKGRAGVLYVLEAFGPMRLPELADRMGWGNRRELKRRYVEPLAELGLVEHRGGLISLPEGHAERVEEVRHAPYTTVSRRRREGRDGDRTIRWVEERENTASEVEREQKDIRAHERQRERFRLHLVSTGPEADERCRELLNRWDEERETPEPDGEISDLERIEPPDPDRTIRDEAEVFDLARSFFSKEEAA